MTFLIPLVLVLLGCACSVADARGPRSHEAAIAVDRDIQAEGDPTEVARVSLPGDGIYLVEVRFVLVRLDPLEPAEFHLGLRGYAVRREGGNVEEVRPLHLAGVGEEIRSVALGYNTSGAPWDLVLVRDRGDLHFRIDSPPDRLRVRIRGRILGASFADEGGSRVLP